MDRADVRLVAVGQVQVIVPRELGQRHNQRRRAIGPPPSTKTLLTREKAGSRRSNAFWSARVLFRGNVIGAGKVGDETSSNPTPPSLSKARRWIQLLYLNSGRSLSASFVAPGRTIFLSFI